MVKFKCKNKFYERDVFMYFNTQEEIITKIGKSLEKSIIDEIQKRCFNTKHRNLIL